MRCLITAAGTGSDTLSYSLQYPQSMLQRRIGTIWTSSGCAVSARPRMNSRSDRALRLVVVRTDMNEVTVRLKPDELEIIAFRPEIRPDAGAASARPPSAIP